MVAVIIAALKALPALVEAIQGIRAEIRTAANNKNERELRKIKEKVIGLTHKFTLTRDRDKMLDIVSDLNSLVDD